MSPHSYRKQSTGQQVGEQQIGKAAEFGVL